jgi:hypothetical protein
MALLSKVGYALVVGMMAHKAHYFSNFLALRKPFRYPYK